MKFVSEDIIDAVVADLEERKDYETELADLQIAQPVIAAYLVSENFDVLTNDEKEYLLYLGLVVTNAVHRISPDIPPVKEEELGKAEETNYETMSASKEKNFRDKLNVFFDNYPQEDLLAFAEDALVIDEEVEDDFFQVTQEGRAPIFIALKSIIDVLNSK